MQNDCFGRHISTISVNHIQGKPYYTYLSNVASGLHAHFTSYIVGDITPTILIWYKIGTDWKMLTAGHSSQRPNPLPRPRNPT